MHDTSIPGAAFAWQKDANDLLGANLVGDVCGKKSYNQALRWARPLYAPDGQNGPLAHVLLVCDKLVDAGQPDAAVNGLRVYAEHLARRGIMVGLDFGLPEVAATASMVSHDLHAAMCEMVEAARAGKPPALLAAHSEEVVRCALAFRIAYGNEFEAEGGEVRFAAMAQKQGMTDGRAERVLRGRWKRFLEVIGWGE